MTPQVLLLLFLSLTATAHARREPRAWEAQVRCFSSKAQNGEWYDFNEPVPDLASYSFDNTIESATVTGMWIFYEETDYNAFNAGFVYWIHGIDFSTDFDSQYSNTASSLRYAGSAFDLNEDSWTVYTGQGFTEGALFGNTDASTLGRFSGEVSSIIVTGTSDWTFYQGEGFTGSSVCLTPDIHHTSDVRRFDVGIFPTPSDFDLTDNSIRSVRKGCHSQ
ncbi:uncharacterized protein [Cherax quadricarinatus]|nr:uncharacterized protein LOC128694481 [Cherax quadricarinatus]